MYEAVCNSTEESNMSVGQRRQVIIPEGLWQKVQSEARSSKTNASAVIRRALERCLGSNETAQLPLPSIKLGATESLSREDYYETRC